MCVYAWSLGYIQLFVTPWTVAHWTSVHGIFQARILEWVAISSSSESSQPYRGKEQQYRRRKISQQGEKYFQAEVKLEISLRG